MRATQGYNLPSNSFRESLYDPCGIFFFCLVSFFFDSFTFVTPFDADRPRKEHTDLCRRDGEADPGALTS